MKSLTAVDICKPFTTVSRSRCLLAARPASILSLGLALALFFAGGSPAFAAESKLKRCLYVGSYHKGYAWQDGIELGLVSTLEGKCEFKRFDMDTQRNTEPEFAQQKALEAKALIESWQPDVVIASDDNASKFLVKPYFKDAKTPFVFCGVNWSVEDYGYPYSNATGMIEIDAIRPLIKEVQRVNPNVKTGACLTQPQISETKFCDRFQEFGNSYGIKLKTITFTTMDEFEKQYMAAQDSDFVVFVNSAGIKGWDAKKAKKIILARSRKLSVAVNEWMNAYTMLSFTKIAEEQGEYSGEVALKILGGAKPSDFPIVSNRKWNIFVNESILNAASIKIPGDLLRKAKKVE